MKKIIHLLITLAVLCGLGYVLWTGARKQEAKDDDEESEVSGEAAAGVEEKPEEYVVTLDKERATLLALEKEPPHKIELQARRIAYGSVMDPSPLVTMDGELAAAEAALAASKAENERTQALVATNDASKKPRRHRRLNFWQTSSRWRR